MIQNQLTFELARMHRPVILNDRDSDKQLGVRIGVRCRLTPRLAEEMGFAHTVYVIDEKEGVEGKNYTMRENLKLYEPGNEYEDFTARFWLNVPNADITFQADQARGFCVERKNGTLEMKFVIVVKEAEGMLFKLIEFLTHAHNGTGFVTITGCAEKQMTIDDVKEDEDDEETPEEADEVDPADQEADEEEAEEEEDEEISLGLDEPEPVAVAADEAPYEPKEHLIELEAPRRRRRGN